jgi:hypothetical protein
MEQLRHARRSVFSGRPEAARAEREGEPMRTLHTTKGLTLIKSPSIRQMAARRRAFTVAGLLALALGSGLVGALTRPHLDPVGQPGTGPFSYFSSE